MFVILLVLFYFVSFLVHRMKCFEKVASDPTIRRAVYASDEVELMVCPNVSVLNENKEARIKAVQRIVVCLQHFLNFSLSHYCLFLFYN